MINIINNYLFKRDYNLLIGKKFLIIEFTILTRIVFFIRTHLINKLKILTAVLVTIISVN